MAVEGDFRTIPGLMAGADLSANQYRAVQMDTTAFRVIAITNANAQRPIGIQQDDPNAANLPVLVAYDGVCRAQAGGTIAVGDTLALDNSGRVITDAEVADGTAVDLHHIAVALEAGALSSIITILLHTPIRIGLE